MYFSWQRILKIHKLEESYKLMESRTNGSYFRRNLGALLGNKCDYFDIKNHHNSNPQELGKIVRGKL